MSAFVNWWSPPPKDAVIKGRTLNLSSGEINQTFTYEDESSVVNLTQFVVRFLKLNINEAKGFEVNIDTLRILLMAQTYAQFSYNIKLSVKVAVQY